MEQFDQNNFAQNEPAQIKSPKTVWVIVITAILVAVLVGVGVYMLQLQRVKNLEKQLSQTNETLKALASKSVVNSGEKTNSNVTSTNEIKIENWQTYKDIKNGIEFKYPAKDYKVLTDSNNLYGWSNSIALLVSTKPGKQSYSASLAIWNSLAEFKKAPNNTIGVPKYYIQNNGKYITFDYWDDNEAEIMKKIISTLKISNNTTTNSTTTSGLPSFLSSIIPATYSPTWNWETYTNNTFGYTISYPRDLKVNDKLDTTNEVAKKDFNSKLSSKSEGYIYRYDTIGIGQLVITPLTNNNKLDLDSWMKKYKEAWPEFMAKYVDTETKYTVASKPALRYYFKGGQSPQQGTIYPGSVVFLVNDKYAFQISYTHDSYEQSKITVTEQKFLEILSTLKFDK